VLIVSVQILGLLGSILTAYHLYRTGLYRKYRFFFWYFLFRIPNTAWPLFFPDTKSFLYFYVWLATEPVTWIFNVAIVLELYRLILEKHKGLYSLGRWAMSLGLGISATVSVTSLIPKMTLALTEQKSITMFCYLAMERGLALALALFLLFMIGFLVLYTVPLSRNVKIHARIYTVFFFSKFLIFLLQSLWGWHSYDKLSTWADGVTALCIFAWFFLLTPKGEEVLTSHPILNAEHERRLLLQLDALNATLLKSSKAKSAHNIGR
jgi:hypothetical protein